MLCFLQLFGGAITTIMWKLILDFLTEPLGLPIEWYWEYAILAVVGFIAYIIAYRCVGKLYYSGVINGRGIGSFLHWLIRLIFFCCDMGNYIWCYSDRENNYFSLDNSRFYADGVISFGDFAVCCSKKEKSFEASSSQTRR